MHSLLRRWAAAIRLAHLSVPVPRLPFLVLVRHVMTPSTDADAFSRSESDISCVHVCFPSTIDREDMRYSPLLDLLLFSIFNPTFPPLHTPQKQNSSDGDYFPSTDPSPCYHPLALDPAVLQILPGATTATDVKRQFLTLLRPRLQGHGGGGGGGARSGVASAGIGVEAGRAAPAAVWGVGRGVRCAGAFHA